MKIPKWTRRELNPHSSGYEPVALTLKLRVLHHSTMGALKKILDNIKTKVLSLVLDSNQRKTVLQTVLLTSLATRHLVRVKGLEPPRPKASDPLTVESNGLDYVLTISKWT